MATSATAQSSIDFGAPSAERDIERGLADYFVESDSYNRVRQGDRRIVIGNRGIGKSAIFQMLARRERDAGSYVIELTPEDYSYELLGQTMVRENSGSWVKLGAYAAAWKYLIYVLIMKEISRKRPHVKGGAADIYRYVRDNHANNQQSKLSALVSYLKRLEGVKIGKYEASLKARELEKLYKLEEINHLIPSLRKVADMHRIIILVDELDRGWDSSEDARAFVAGLFQACISVNSLHRSLRIYMSLRQEIYEDVPALYDDAQKFRDLIENIHWTEESLLNLIAKRIRHSIPSIAASDDQACWDALFPSGPSGRGWKSFNYMIDRTLYRPREIIQFCAEAVECSRTLSGLPARKPAITQAERAYSAERARDIAAEYRFQYPGLLSVLESFRGKPGVFDREELEFLCLELVTGEIPAPSAAGWIGKCTPDEIIEILWNIGFLCAGTVPAAGARQSSREIYLGVHQARHLNLAASQHFRVHPMFWAHLGLDTAKR